MKVRKIGILTQPLHDNYGGLLQAYALKTTLEALGHEVEIINRRKPYHSFKYKIVRFLNKLRGRKVQYTLNKTEQVIISKNTRYFAEKYIKDITPAIYSSSELEKIKNNYDTFVVGSDQVWKPSYSPDIANYFLDFVKDKSAVGVSYAASFGGDTWDYSAEQTKVCKENVNKFRAISVREDSGIELCKQNLGVSAVHVLDPTMLLDAKHYVELVVSEKEPVYKGKNLIHYVLDSTKHKTDLINSVAKNLGLETATLTVKRKIDYNNVKNHIDDCIYPTVTSWLNGFYQADFIVTDSFHGTVFSILFNKPFIVMANPRRGNSRFHSLLKMFGLEDRLVLDADNFSIDFFNQMKVIDWENVNDILKKWREQSMGFLDKNLR